jgi:choline-sulfatase
MKRLRHLFLATALGLASTAAPAKKPNIVFVFTDDQAVDTIAATNVWGTGPAVVQTPNLDRLAHSGTCFSRAYNMGAWHGAVCVASRSMLNTGRFLWHSYDAEKETYRSQLDNRRFWSQRMQTAGYETYMTGKWHVQVPAENLFDHVTHVRPGMPSTVPTAYNRPLKDQPDPWLPWDASNGGYWTGGKHWSEVLAADAETFIQQAATGDKPFFMYLAFNAPHDPRQSPQSFVDMYPLGRIPVPENFKPLNPHHAAMGLGPASPKAMRDEALAPFPRTEFAIKTHRREYYALVSHLDVQIGRVLDSLDRAGVSENTYVILTSDHGLALGRHGLLGKQNMFEHSLRVPFIIRGPGIPKGETRDARIYLQDAMATALDLADADTKDIDFKSVLPLIKDARKTQYETIYGAFTTKNQRAVIDGNHKLVLYPTSKTVLLFDLANDPLEMTDLAARPESTVVKQRLFASLRELQRQTGDPLDLTEIYPELSVRGTR